ncbi:MAG TPA: hypothetical protein VFJ51_13640 [Nitrososphaeraceae archaeon]|nr:hypothetical protein [Nitrososphaeraceae archaeon]
MSNDVLQDELPEKNGWWINELESLGIDTKSNPNELKDKQDNSDLVEAIKQTFIEEYKQTYQ